MITRRLLHHPKKNGMYLTSEIHSQNIDYFIQGSYLYKNRLIDCFGVCSKPSSIISI